MFCPQCDMEVETDQNGTRLCPHGAVIARSKGNMTFTIVPRDAEEYQEMMISPIETDLRE